MRLFVREAAVITLYGIRNCDTMKKAQQWLATHDVDYRLHDYRRDGLDEARLRRWTRELGWDALLNRRGLTWRRLPERTKANLTVERAIALMLAKPALIKRPLLDLDRTRHLGFDPAAYRTLFGRC